METPDARRWRVAQPLLFFFFCAATYRKQRKGVEVWLTDCSGEKVPCCMIYSPLLIYVCTYQRGGVYRSSGFEDRSERRLGHTFFSGFSVVLLPGIPMAASTQAGGNGARDARRP